MKLFYIALLFLISLNPININAKDNNKISKKQIDSNIRSAILFLRMACVAGGEKLTIEGSAEAGLTLRKWEKAGVQAHVRVNKEAVMGLLDNISTLSAQNAQNTRGCSHDIMYK